MSHSLFLMRITLEYWDTGILGGEVEAMVMMVIIFIVMITGFMIIIVA